MAIHLGRASPRASSNQPGRRCGNAFRSRPKPQSCAVPIRFCSRRGLPCQPCRQRCGALLPHPFTLTLSRSTADRAMAASGGLLSVALSLGSPPPDVIRRRVSVEPGLSSTRKELDLAAHTAPCEQRPSGQLAQWSKGDATACVKWGPQKCTDFTRAEPSGLPLLLHARVNRKQRQTGVPWNTKEL